MELITISVEPRTERGTNEVRQMRKQGRVPAVIYSSGTDAVSITLNAHEFAKIYATGSRKIFTFKSEDKELDGTTSLIKSVDREPIKEEILHVDFLAIVEGSKVTVTVPIHYVGEALCEKQKTGVISTLLHEIEVECLPRAIPEEILLDISTLDVGESRHVSDLKIPEGAELKTDPSQTVVTATIKRAEEEVVAPVVEEGELAEGELAEGEVAEGEAGVEGEEKPDQAQAKAQKSDS